MKRGNKSKKNKNTLTIDTSDSALLGTNLSETNSETNSESTLTESEIFLKEYMQRRFIKSILGTYYQLDKLLPISSSERI